MRQMRERGGRHTRCGIPPDDDNAAAQICPLQGDGFLCRRPLGRVVLRSLWGENGSAWKIVLYARPHV